MLINHGSDEHNEIYILNGQNISQIENYKQLKNTNKWNPCIPITFNGDKSITITFTNNSINWYPLKICDYQNNLRYYRNEFLFDGGKSLTINNLNINNYIINKYTNYPILRSINNYNASITVNNGSFINISCQQMIPLFYTRSSLYIHRTTFKNIRVSDVVFYATHDDRLDSAIRSITFKNILFDNISAARIYASSRSHNDVK